MDEFQQYDNTALLFVGNEVLTSGIHLLNVSDVLELITYQPKGPVQPRTSRLQSATWKHIVTRRNTGRFLSVTLQVQIFLPPTEPQWLSSSSRCTWPSPDAPELPRLRRRRCWTSRVLRSQPLRMVRWLQLRRVRLLGASKERDELQHPHLRVRNGLQSCKA